MIECGELANDGPKSLESTLSANGYDQNTIYKNLRNTLDRLFTKSKNNEIEVKNNKNEEKIAIKLPFSEGAKYLKYSLKKYFDNNKFRLIFKSKKISNYFSNKSTTPKALLANLVYQFNCNGCDATYIGETKRHLRTRVSEHMQLSRKSSILDHVCCCKNRKEKISIDEFTVLNSGFGSYFERIACEALRIGSHNPVLNTQIDTHALLNLF